VRWGGGGSGVTSGGITVTSFAPISADWGNFAPRELTDRSNRLSYLYGVAYASLWALRKGLRESGVIRRRLPTLVFLLYQKGRDSRIQAQDGYDRRDSEQQQVTADEDRGRLVP
jgi:hypothetical protein